MRSIVLLLTATTLLAGCDKRSPATGQANRTDAVAADEANAVTPDEVVAPPAASGVDMIGKLDRGHKGGSAPTAAFVSPGGAKTSLAAFAGKPFLLNLWATWCGPCKIEMPTLDRIAGEGKLTVVAVSQDIDGAKAVAPYFEAKRFKAVKPYLDPALGFSAALGNPSLPTTILYDAQGREVWRMTGGMDWTSPTARALLAEAE